MTLLLLAPVGPAAAEQRVIAVAEQAIARGQVVPERDLAPLLAVLSRPVSEEVGRELVDAVENLGACDGPSPNAVKRYFADAAPPVLLQLVRAGGGPFLLGDALAALRGLCVSREVLADAARVALASSDAFVQSRGEILQNYLVGLPVEDATKARRPVDPVAEQKAIAVLDARRVPVTTAALRSAARDAIPEVVAALLDAGIAPDTGVADLQQTPLYFAVTVGCSSQGEDTDWLVETVHLLIAAGADLARLDDNRNSQLHHAAHNCGGRVVGELIAGGAAVGPRNGSGSTPLALALYGQRLDAAEALVARGARLTAEEATAVRSIATDDRARAIIRRASGGG